jgi:hypothetical protein
MRGFEKNSLSLEGRGCHEVAGEGDLNIHAVFIYASPSPLPLSLQGRGDKK